MANLVVDLADIVTGLVLVEDRAASGRSARCRVGAFCPTTPGRSPVASWLPLPAPAGHAGDASTSPWPAANSALATWRTGSPRTKYSQREASSPTWTPRTRSAPRPHLILRTATSVEALEWRPAGVGAPRGGASVLAPAVPQPPPSWTPLLARLDRKSVV